MGLETYSDIDSFNTSNPAGSDSRTQGDDHIRGIKAALKGGSDGTLAQLQAGTSTARKIWTPAVLAAAFGGGAWTYTGVSSNQTLVNGDNKKRYVVDTSGGSISITLPTHAAATEGWTVQVVKGTTDANVVNIKNSAGTIIGLLHVGGEGCTILSDGSSDPWMFPEHMPRVNGIYSGTGVTLGTSLTKLDISTADVDPLGMIDSGNDQVVIEQPGWYLLHAAMNVTTPADIYCTFKINGATVETNFNDADNAMDVDRTMAFYSGYLAPSDTITVYGIRTNQSTDGDLSYLHVLRVG